MNENNLKIGNLIKIPLNSANFKSSFTMKYGIVIGYDNIEYGEYAYNDIKYQTYIVFIPQLSYTGVFYRSDLKKISN